MHTVVGDDYWDLGAAAGWQKEGEAAVEAPDVSCPSRVLQQSRSVRFDQRQSPWLGFAFIAYIFNPESLKADWNSEKYQLLSDRFNFKTLGFSMFMLEQETNIPLIKKN